MLDLLANPEVWVAFLTLTLLEIVLGIDNIVFISILTGRLPEHQRARARLLGLSAAMFMRIALLLSLSWIMGLSEDLFEVFGHGVSGRDIILIAGGAFLHRQGHAGDAQLAGVPRARKAMSAKRSRVSARCSSRSPSSTWCSRLTRSSPRWGWWTKSR